MTTLAAPTLTGEDRFALSGISWEFYLQCCEELSDRRVRLTYNEGELEFMVTKAPHEFYKTMLAKLVEMLIFEINLPVVSGGSITVQRADLQKGFEPDECWWLENARSVHGKKEIDFVTDPPPDLAVEVEITNSLANRVGIYSAIGVPEIWRFNGRQLRFCRLQPAGEYADIETSTAFPFLRPADLLPFLGFDDPRDETTRLHEFVTWFRNRQP